MRKRLSEAVKAFGGRPDFAQGAAVSADAAAFALARIRDGSAMRRAHVRLKGRPRRKRGAARGKASVRSGEGVRRQGRRPSGLCAGRGGFRGSGEICACADSGWERDETGACPVEGSPAPKTWRCTWESSCPKRRRRSAARAAAVRTSRRARRLPRKRCTSRSRGFGMGARRDGRGQVLQSLRFSRQWRAPQKQI